MERDNYFLCFRYHFFRYPKPSVYCWPTFWILAGPGRASPFDQEFEKKIALHLLAACQQSFQDFPRLPKWMSIPGAPLWTALLSCKDDCSLQLYGMAIQKSPSLSRLPWISKNMLQNGFSQPCSLVKSFLLLVISRSSLAFFSFIVSVNQLAHFLLVDLLSWICVYIYILTQLYMYIYIHTWLYM